MYGHVSPVRGVKWNWGAAGARLGPPAAGRGGGEAYSRLARTTSNRAPPLSGMMSAFAPLTRNLNWYYVYIASKIFCDDTAFYLAYVNYDDTEKEIWIIGHRFNNKRVLLKSLALYFYKRG